MKASVSIRVGVDPGSSSGCICVVMSEDGEHHVEFHDLDKQTPADLSVLSNRLRYYVLQGYDCKAVLEKVHAMPKQGVVSSFKFGQSFGYCIMFLACAGVPYDIVTPQQWQKLYVPKRTKTEKVTEHKRKLRDAAQRRYPGVKMRIPQADSLLLADFANQII